MAKDRITATPVRPLGERDHRMDDPELAAELLSARMMDSESEAAAVRHEISADPLPPNVRDEEPFYGRGDTSIDAPAEMPNPDDDGRQVDEAARRIALAQQQAQVRKDAVAEHIRDIDADADHPLRGANGRSRLPFGSRSARLSAPARPGFHRHWFNAVPDRIERALRAGYKIVLDPDKKPMKRVVGRDDNNQGLYAYYMEIPIDWYVQDMRNARKSADDLERTIRRGKLGAVERHYTPKSGIEYEEEASGDYRPRA